MKTLSTLLATLFIASGSAIAVAQDSSSQNGSPQTQTEKSGCPEAGSVPTEQLSEKCRSEAATGMPSSNSSAGETTGTIDPAPASEENNSGSEQNKQ